MAVTLTPWLLGEPSDLVEVSAADRHGKPLRTVLNRRTGLVRNDPVPSDAELAQFYSKDYRVAYKGAAQPRKRQAFRNFRRAAAYIDRFNDVISQAQNILDVGAGSGEFLFLARAIGKTAQGIEPNEGYAAFCREEYGLNVRTALLEPDLFEAQSFDFIRLNHVLEHLNDPVKYLAMIARWLKPGGVFYVEVPNIEAYCKSKSKGGMFHYGHIYNFTPWTLRAAAALAGLREYQVTAERCANSTGVFFVAAENHEFPQRNESHGQELQRLLMQHAHGGPQQARGMKMLRKFAVRVDEFLNIAGSKSYSDIGNAVARTLKLQ